MRTILAMVPETRHGFDAYGAPRANRKWTGTTWDDDREGNSPLPTRTQQGFTGHERLAGLKLIHMKGRVFDPVMGRFHGVDPIIQFPLSSQGLNPYSYILNNPMAGTDPTGYAARCRELPKEGEVCEAEVPREKRERSGDARSDFRGGTTVTIANNGGDLYVTAGRGPNAYRALEGAINGIGSIDSRSNGPQMMASPKQIREHCSGSLGICSAWIHDLNEPSALSSWAGDAWASMWTPSGNIAVNPLTGRIVSDRQAHIGLMMDVASLFLGAANSKQIASYSLSRHSFLGLPLRFSQRTASRFFSDEGSFNGRLVVEVADALRSGAMKVESVPVQVLVRDGSRLIINTRSSLALRQAGISESRWRFVNMNGVESVEVDITERLLRNTLPGSGSDVIKITGMGPGVSASFVRP